MATHNSQLKRYNGSEWDIYNPKTLASLVGTVAQGGANYSTSRQFVTGDMLDKLSLSVNSANSFLTLDSSGLIPLNTLPVDLLTGLDAVPYDGSADPVNGDLLAYKNGETSYIKQSALSLSKSQVGLGNVDNTSDANKPVSTAQQTALNLKLNATLKGAANGLAELDANGKVPLTQINDSLLGQVEYKGVWNASTNSPTLASTPTEKGVYYVTSVAGTQFGKTFEVGDWIIASGTTGSLYWDKVDNTDAVSSVNAKTGVVVLTASDVGARASNWVPSYADLTGTKPTYTASEVGARPDTWVPSYSDITGTKPPSGAQVNIIEAVQVNGTALSISSKTVNVTRTLVGANKTFIGSTAPVGAIEGDLWFDTSA